MATSFAQVHNFSTCCERDFALSDPGLVKKFDFIVELQGIIFGNSMN